MKIRLVLVLLLLSIFSPTRSDAVKPSSLPASPWQLTRAVRHAYEAHDQEALRSLVCWDRTDSTIRATTDSFIDQVMREHIVSMAFKPLHGEDQVIAFGPDSRTYRYNLEHVGYLELNAPKIQTGFSVGRDARGYRITLWVPTAEHLTLADWNRPPPPREWLDGYYRHSSPHAPGYYNFRDSAEAASYYHELLVLAFEDEVSGHPPWMSPPYHLQARADILEHLRVHAVDGSSPSGSIALPAVRWCLFTEPDHAIQAQAMDLLERIVLPQSDSLIVELLTRGHPNASIIVQALSAADARGIKIPRDVLLPYLRHYRPSMAAASRALNEHLGYPAVPALDAMAELHSPEVHRVLESLDSLFAPPLGPDTRFVTMTWHLQDSEDADHDETERGWMVFEDSTSKTLMTPEGRFETIPWKQAVSEDADSTSHRVEVSLTETAIESEAERILRLPAGGSSRPEGRRDRPWMGRAGEGGTLGHEAFLGYRLYEAHRDTLAAQILLRALDACDADSELIDAAQSAMGQLHGYRMLAAFAGDRDYSNALQEATLIANRYPHSRFAAYAKELVRQLPLRMDDFKSLRLPTSKEWVQMRATIGRPEQIRFLCNRLRLLSNYRAAPQYAEAQYAEAPGMDVLASCFLGPGKTPVINPLIELQGAMDSPGAETSTQTGGMHLTLSDIPVLAPYLLETWFLGDIFVPGGIGNNDPSDPERTMADTGEIIAGIIQSLLPHHWNPRWFDDLDTMTETDRKERIARIIAWAERNKNRDERAQVVDAVKESQDYFELFPMLDYLAEHKVKEAVPKLLTFLDDDAPNVRTDYILSCCRRIDSERCVSAARKHLVDMNYMTRFNAGLILYAHGEKVDGLMAMAAGFQSDQGCLLRSGDPVEDAVSRQLSSHGTDELAVARMALNAHCFPNSPPQDQWPLIRLFSEAHEPVGLEVFLRELADSSITEDLIGDRLVAVHRREDVAKFILETLMPSRQDLKFQYGDPPEMKSRAVEAARNWVANQIEKMKKTEQN